eukprot:scaffold2910_cov390-Prasinococcus_capsulatus_cf.AAC.53
MLLTIRSGCCGTNLLERRAVYEPSIDEKDETHLLAAVVGVGDIASHLEAGLLSVKVQVFINLQKVLGHRRACGEARRRSGAKTT